MLLGALSGDIIGSPFEFNNIKQTDFDMFCKGSRFTDDSVMTLAIAWAILNTKDNESDFKRTVIESMHALGHEYPKVGYGYKFVEWLKSPIDSCSAYGSWGNGSAMRVSPVGWAYSSLGLTERIAKLTAEVTHNDPAGIRGAQSIASGTYLARTGRTKSEIKDYVASHYGYKLDFTLDEIRPHYSFDVSCDGSVPVAFVAFFEGNSFEDVARKAVSVGGDSDTICPMACALAQGIYEVPNSIEQESRARLDERLLFINDAFCEKYHISTVMH